MKPITLIPFILATLFVGWLLGRFTTSRSQANDGNTSQVATASEYTCSMHPQIRQPKPGKCPICAMDLIPAGSSDTGGPARELSLSPHAKALARIVTTPVERRIPEAEIRLFGRVLPDESRVRSLSARFPARIEQLYVNYTGLKVQAGDHLAAIYSPDLLTAQSELLSALKFNDPRALRSARDKFALWGFSQKTISDIETRGTPTDTLDIDAPLSGFVTDKKVAEGDYVDTGAVMFQITDLSAVWVVLDAYEMDKSWLRFGQPVTFTAEALPGQAFEGRIAFIPPVLDPVSRTFKVRLNIDNPDLLLRPGMFITGTVHARFSGTGVQADPSLADKWISPMHPEIVKSEPGTCDVCGMDLVPASELGYSSASEEEPPVVVPATAVLQTGRRAIVYIEVPDRDAPTYEGREIVLGPRAGDVYVVASGLEAGERVVVHGAFKLDSALQLLAKPSMMSAPDPDAPPEIEASPEMREAVGHLATAYLPLWRTFADDDLSGAHEASAALQDVAKDHETPPGTPEAMTFFKTEFTAITRALTELDQADNIKAARQSFEHVSISLIRLVKSVGIPPDLDLRLAYCPMAFGGRRADWLQQGEPLLNPYFGDAMLHCGEFEGLLLPAAPPVKAGPAHSGHSHP
jgi:Cu(I)/Ag(I) efflux system membrane fusion protein